MSAVPQKRPSREHVGLVAKCQSPPYAPQQIASLFHEYVQRLPRNREHFRIASTLVLPCASLQAMHAA